jgi:hypothetical protein
LEQLARPNESASRQIPTFWSIEDIDYFWIARREQGEPQATMKLGHSGNHTSLIAIITIEELISDILPALTQGFRSRKYLDPLVEVFL